MYEGIINYKITLTFNCLIAFDSKEKNLKILFERTKNFSHKLYSKCGCTSLKTKTQVIIFQVLSQENKKPNLFKTQVLNNENSDFNKKTVTYIIL